MVSAQVVPSGQGILKYLWSPCGEALPTGREIPLYMAHRLSLSKCSTKAASRMLQPEALIQDALWSAEPEFTWVYKIYPAIQTLQRGVH